MKTVAKERHPNIRKSPLEIPVSTRIRSIARKPMDRPIDAR
jgi:hypothetical protein